MKCWPALLSIGLMGSPSWAAPAPEVRFYEQLTPTQERRLLLTPGSREPGCHNFPFRRRVHRVAQVRFSWCTLYPESDCPEESAYPALWGRNKGYARFRNQPTIQLFPGAQWILSAKGNLPVGSWRCELEDK